MRFEQFPTMLAGKIHQDGGLYVLIDAAQEAKLIQSWLDTGAAKHVRSLFENTPESKLPLSCVPLLYRLSNENFNDMNQQVEKWLQLSPMISVLNIKTSVDDCIQHLQKFLDAMLPSGEPALLRFYDPSVQAFLPYLLDEKHYEQLLSPIINWWYSKEDGTFTELSKTYPAHTMEKAT